MLRRGLLTLVLVLPFPACVAAQAADPAASFAPRSNMASRLSPSSAPICDGSVVRSARQRGFLGLAVMGAALPVSLIGMYKTVHSPSHPQGPVATGIAAGAGLAIAGFALVASAHPRESFWESAIASMKTGVTRSDDVRACFDRPVAQTSTDSLDEWTYITSRFTRVKAVKLTFRDSVLVGIKRTEIDASLVQSAEAPQAPVIPPVVIPVVPPPR